MNRSIVLLSLGLALGGALGYWLHRPEPSASFSADRTFASSPAHEGRRVLYWYDPMQPSQHFDKPGKSPYMDMELLPKYADTDSSATGVRLDTTAAQNLGIRTAPVERGVLKRSLRAVGTVGYDENEVAVVQARVTGYIAHLRVRASLTSVHRGQALVDVVAPEWAAAEQEFVALQHAPNVDAALRAAARDRLRVLGVPDGDIAAIERTGKVPSQSTLFAPIDGVLSELDARDGMAVSPGTPLFRISGLARVWVTAEIPEAQAASARQHGTASVHVPAWPGRAFEGNVIAILPNVSATTRTQSVRIEVSNADGALSPGMYADVALAPAAEVPATLVPTEAIFHTGTRAVVIAVDGGAYRAVEIHTGAESDGKTEVFDGLAAGDRVVVSGQFLIDSEASLRATLTRLGTPSSGSTP